VVDPMKAAVASSVKDAITALSSGNLTTSYSPAPTFEALDENADTYSKTAADSGIPANKTAEATVPKAEPIKEQAAEKPVSEQVKATPAPAAETVKKEIVPEPVQKTPEPVQKVPEPTVEHVPVKEPIVQPEQPAAETVSAPQEPVRKNSYMELFAKRRRRTEPVPEVSEQPAAPEAVKPAERPVQPTVQPVPEAVKPIEKPIQPAVQPVQEAVKPIEKPVQPAPAKPPVQPKPVQPLAPGNIGDNIIDFDFIMDEEPAAPVNPIETPKTENIAADSIDMDVYDFISEDSGSKVSSRVLNAVQDLAKAKAAAEAAAEAEKKKAAEEQKNAPAQTSESENDILEKMRRDIETLAEESEHEMQTEEETESPEEEEGLEGFTFSNDVDYDLDAEFAEPEKPAEKERAESSTDLDIKKLQEEINASIEKNKATKERLEARHKKEKEEPHNPFAVQFEEEDDKKKKKEKEPPKRLADPIDPDIFFSRPTKNYDMDSESMPEIKFRNK